MIPVTIVPHVDLLNVIGVRVPGEVVLLPFAEWPSTNGAIELPECTVTRYVPPAAKRPAFTKRDDRPGLYPLPEPPKAPDDAPAVAPRAFCEWLAAQLPDRGPVEPTPPDHPAHARLVAAYHAGKVTARGLNAGSNFDLAWAVDAHNLDLAARMLGLDGAIVGPQHAGEVVRGASHPGALRDEILADFDAEQALLRQEAERVAAARARETELLTVDLAEAGLIEVTTDDPRISFGRVKVYDGPRRRVLMRSHGIATGDGTQLYLSTRDRSVAKVKVRDRGTVQATRKDLSEVGALDDAIVIALRQERAPTKRYAAGDFTGDVRTLEGRHALHLLRARAASLVHSLATAPGNSAVGAFLMHLVLTIPAAFGGAVSLPNCVDAVQVALRDYAASKSIGRTYDRNGQPSEVAPIEGHTWPQGLLKPDEVPRAMLAELGRGSAWIWGEALRAPTDDEARRLRAELDPALWARTVDATIADRAEVRSQDVYDALFAVGLLAGPTPNAEQRGRVSDALSRSGFTKVRAEGNASARQRVWRRAVRAMGPAPEVDRGRPAAPHV